MFNTMLYDFAKEPKQQQPIEDRHIEANMVKEMVELMKENDAPEEQYRRLGLK